ncbi:MAG: myo-inositol-1(or 4)-monophosphatase [Phenylobacterium sp.]|jgi:myo-inositol-1(or 4)-monophosphatase
MQPMLNIAIRAARNAGKIIAQAFEEHDKIESSSKGPNDFVTNIDKDAEQAIINTLRKSYPDHCIVGEELGEQIGENTDYQWIVDPLDGTTNFIRGIPHFSVSIALKVKGKLDQAVIYDPIRSELFTASRGGGAQLNGNRMRCSKSKEIEGTVLATGFPHKNKHQIDAYLAMFKTLFVETSDIRRSGSAALDLAYVAAGRVDGFWEMGLKPWDTAAGQLLIKETGGLCTDFVGGANQDRSGNIVAGNPKMVKAMVKAIRPCLNESLSQ